MRLPADEKRAALEPTGAVESLRAWILVGLTVVSCLGYGCGHVEGRMGDYVREKAGLFPGWLHRAGE